MINLNDTTPAATSGTANVKWQVDASGNVSANYAIAATRQTVAISANTLTVDVSQGSIIEVSLNQNITSIVLNNPVDGQEILFYWIQDATGGRTITYPSSMVGGEPPISTANSVTIQKWTYRSADTTWRAETYMQGLIAKYDATAQSANIAATTIFAVPATGAGMYHISGYIVVTTAATTSSTLPSIVITWTDADNNTSQSLTLTATNAGNALTTFAQALAAINAKASTNIQISTTGYVSSGATAMQYAIHGKVKFVGN